MQFCAWSEAKGMDINMKILHTGDWHLGKVVHSTHMTDDQVFILEQFLKLVEQERPDVVLIAGDIYDRSVPPTEAVELLDEVLSKLVVEYQTQVIMIAGNHDSPDRLGFANKILRDQGLNIRGNLEREIQPIVLEDEYGKVNVYAIPYAEPAVVRALFEDKTIKDHDAAMKRIMESIESRMDHSERNICMTHGFVTGVDTLETSESERRLSIGGSEYVSAEYFDAFDYTALGHLHRPQKVKKDCIRYAGSLLKYSFSEALQKKSITMVEMNGDGQVDITLHSLSPKHDMRVIRGELDQLLDPNVYSAADKDDYIMAMLTNRGELIDPIGKLRGVYPNILRLQRETFEREAGDEKTSAGHNFIEKSPIDLFEEFYENASGETFSEEKQKEMEHLLDELERNRRNA